MVCLQLVDFVHYNPGFEVKIGNVEAIRLQTGDWQEKSATGTGRRFRNYSEMALAAVEEQQEISKTRTGKRFWDWLKKTFFPN